MAKSHCDHHVVIRGPTDKIVFDRPFDNFARAKPLYLDQIANLPDDHELTLQHGARIVLKTPRKTSGSR